MGNFYLAIAIIAEVIGTTALKASKEFTSPIPRSLSENRSRSEGELIRGRFFHDLRRILGIFNENHG